MNRKASTIFDENLKRINEAVIEYANETNVV